MPPALKACQGCGVDVPGDEPDRFCEPCHRRMDDEYFDRWQTPLGDPEAPRSPRPVAAGAAFPIVDPRR